jgi:hypothetical protein
VSYTVDGSPLRPAAATAGPLVSASAATRETL